MRLILSTNDRFTSCADIPDEYYKALSTWKKRNIGAWYKRPSKQDNEAMQYLKDILERGLFTQEEKNNLLKQLNLGGNNNVD